MGKRNRWASSSSEDEDERYNTNHKKNGKIANSKNRALLKKGYKEDFDNHDTSQLQTAPSSSQNLPTKPDNDKDSSNNSNVKGSLPIHNPLTQGCRSVYDTFERISHISEGTYGVVWKARNLATNEIVALKQMKFDVSSRQEGFPVIALREIQVLLALQHDSIVSVQEVVTGSSMEQVYMVMEYYEFDLKVALDRYEGALAQRELKFILKHVLSGLSYMHSRYYLHRDLKTSNLLVHSTGKVAIADFGLARRYQEPYQPLTQLVCTLWYRAPELLLGETCYGPPIDCWSVGCILGELVTKTSILQGQGELDQLDQIYALVGVPDQENWPGYSKLPHAGMFRWKNKNKTPTLPQKFRVGIPSTSSDHAYLDSQGYNLLERLLTLDPAQRISAKEALEHNYFVQGVAPEKPMFLVQRDDF